MGIPSGALRALFVWSDRLRLPVLSASITIGAVRSCKWRNAQAFGDAQREGEPSVRVPGLFSGPPDDPEHWV